MTLPDLLRARAETCRRNAQTFEASMCRGEALIQREKAMAFDCAAEDAAGYSARVEVFVAAVVAIETPMLPSTWARIEAARAALEAP